MFADKMKAFDNVKQIFIEVMEKNIAFLQSSPVDLFDVVKEYINTIRKIDTIEIEKVKTVLQLQNLLEDIGYLHCKAGGFHFKRNEPTTILL